MHYHQTSLMFPTFKLFDVSKQLNRILKQKNKYFNKKLSISKSEINQTWRKHLSGTRINFVKISARSMKFYEN